MTIFRLSGRVTDCGERRWSTRDGERSGTLNFARVQISDLVLTEVTLSEHLVDKVKKDESVDLAVEVTAQGGYLRAQAVNEWPRQMAVAGGSHAKAS